MVVAPVIATTSRPANAHRVEKSTEESVSQDSVADLTRAREVVSLSGIKQQGEKTGLGLAAAAVGSPLGFLAACWGTEALDTVLGGALDNFGIVPRSVTGLVGVPLAPFLHSNWEHLFSNSLGVLTAGSLVALHGPKKFRDVTIMSGLAAGLGTWAAGRTAIHLGASGVVYGYLGFLMTRGLFDRRPLPIVLSVLSTALFAGSLAGVLPGKEAVSWESHLFGLAGGVLAAATLPVDAPRNRNPFGR